MKVMKYSLKLSAQTVWNRWRNRPKIDFNIAGGNEVQYAVAHLNCTELAQPVL